MYFMEWNSTGSVEGVVQPYSFKVLICLNTIFRMQSHVLYVNMTFGLDIIKDYNY